MAGFHNKAMPSPRRRLTLWLAALLLFSAPTGFSQVRTGVKIPAAYAAAALKPGGVSPQLPSLPSAGVPGLEPLSGLPSVGETPKLDPFKKYPPMSLLPAPARPGPGELPSGPELPHGVRLGFQAEGFINSGADPSRYSRLQPESLKELRGAYAALLKQLGDQRDLRSFQVKDLDDDKLLRQTLQAGEDLAGKYSDSKDWIVGVGRSPTAIVLAAQLHDSTPRRFAAIPFSREFKPFWVRRPDSDLSGGQVDGMRKHLAAYGLDPASIAERPGKTVLVDYVIEGRSISKFVGIIDEWAKELRLDSRVREKLALHLVSMPSWADRLKAPFLKMLPEKWRDRLAQKAAAPLVSVPGYHAKAYPVGPKLGASLARRDFSQMLGAGRFEPKNWAEAREAKVADDMRLTLLRFRLIDAKESAKPVENAPQPAPKKKTPLSDRLNKR